jgi:hypothetical protein
MLEGKGIKGKNGASQQAVSGQIEHVVSSDLVADDQFGLLLMWSEKYKQDMWYVERLMESNERQDYYGPFFHKCNAEKFKNNEL